MPEEPRFAYGGQAVIEGVLIRGRNHFNLAVRRPDGGIERRWGRLNSLATGRARRLPFVRGFIVLAETLVLGIKALHTSANLAAQQPEDDSKSEIPNWALVLTLAASLAIGVGIFLGLPLLIVRVMDPWSRPTLVSELIERALNLIILVGYVWAISFFPDIKRVFAYHGAEHMAVHAHEASLPLSVENVRKFGTPHPRCGTAFLLTVVLVSVVVFLLFALLEQSWWWRAASRIMLLPVIAAISYEIIRFSGTRQHLLVGQLLALPGLWLQRLTTREPDDGQIEVAICAVEGALAADDGREYTPSFGADAAEVNEEAGKDELVSDDGSDPAATHPSV